MSARLSWRLWLLLAIVAIVAGAATAWIDRKPAGFRATDITGSSVGADFSMTDHNGKPRRLSDFKGKVVVVFFGFLNCPDVCPTTLARAAAVMKRLGAKASEVQVLLVTVDPERDTLDLLRSYVTSFDPRFLGLRGTQQELDAAARAFKIVYMKSPTPGGGYTMDHTASSFAVDKEGRTRLLISHETSADAMGEDIARLVDEKSS